MLQPNPDSRLQPPAITQHSADQACDGTARDNIIMVTGMQKLQTIIMPKRQNVYGWYRLYFAQNRHFVDIK